MAKDKDGHTYISEGQSRARGEWEERKNEKIARAEACKEARAKRTDEQQLARLDELLGEGVGAVRERARLLKRIEKRKKVEKQDNDQDG